MTKGICYFCGQEKELINSHIMPKCFYKIDEYGPIRLYKPNSKESFIDNLTYLQNTFLYFCNNFICVAFWDTDLGGKCQHIIISNILPLAVYRRCVFPCANRLC